LALSEWGLYLDDLDEIALGQLAVSYIRRKRFESKLLLGALGEMMGGGEPQKIPGDLMLGILEGKI